MCAVLWNQHHRALEMLLGLQSEKWAHSPARVWQSVTSFSAPSLDLATDSFLWITCSQQRYLWVGVGEISNRVHEIHASPAKGTRTFASMMCVGVVYRRIVTIFEYNWLYLIQYDNIWLYVIVFDYIWLYVRVFDYVWVCMLIYLCILTLLAVLVAISCAQYCHYLIFSINCFRLFLRREWTTTKQKTKN